MTNHWKIREATKARDSLMTVDLLPSDDCQAVWTQISKDLKKQHRNMNWQAAYQALPVQAPRCKRGREANQTAPGKPTQGRQK